MSDLAHADRGVIAPDNVLERHYDNGGTSNGNTELAVSQLLYALAIANRSQYIVETGVNNAAGATPWLIAAAIKNGGNYVGYEISQVAAQRAHRAMSEMFNSPAAAICCANALYDLPRDAQPGTIDLLFVDDDHHRAHVEAELLAFRPLMRAGGLMCFHDVVGVHEHDVWDVIAPYGAVKLVGSPRNTDEPFGGLGVIVC